MENLIETGCKNPLWRRVQFSLSQTILGIAPIALFSFFKITLTLVYVYIVRNMGVGEFMEWLILVWGILILISGGYVFYKGVGYSIKKCKANDIAFKQGTYYT